MLLGITGFEIRYQLKNPVFWVAIAIFFIWLGVRRLHASWRQKRARDDDQRAPRRDPEQQR